MLNLMRAVQNNLPYIPLNMYMTLPRLMLQKDGLDTKQSRSNIHQAEPV